jgi:hypothetical protein
VAALPGWLMEPKFQETFHVPVALERAEILFKNFYNVEWAQYPFPYYNVQSLDIVQMPRMPEDMKEFEDAFKPLHPGELGHLVARRWQLTNTRYLLGASGFLEFLNLHLDTSMQRFKVIDQFQLVPRPGILAPTRASELMTVPQVDGNLAMFEFTGALPRVKLFSDWEVVTNRADALKEITSVAFDPLQKVVVDDPLPAPGAGATNTPAGVVEISSYAPKKVVLKAKASAASVLLLNDRFDPNWQATVDGTPNPILHCNFLMRGVFLTPGDHTIEFRFRPPVGLLWVSLAADGIALLLFGYVLVAEQRRTQPAPAVLSKPIAVPAAIPVRPSPAKSAKPARVMRR